jgi:hypothetical protein
MPLLAPCAGHPAPCRAHSRLVEVAPLAPRHRQILALQATRRFITTTVVLGGALLTATVERAWALGARRVWVHTCSLDHPNALPGYQARGFRVFKIVHTEEELPERSPGPWPGAFPTLP